MRIAGSARWALLALCALCFSTVTLAWTPEDHEIFDLVSALEAAEGPKTSFYSFLNVTPAASTADVAKAYRKRSLELHPDRGGDEERFARLGVIANILRDAEKRKRYHYFYENGVPRWRGTGYYYARYRPGLGTVLVFLALLSNLVQYTIQHLVRYGEVARIRRFQDKAKEAAWGSVSAKPSNENIKKKVRVSLGSESTNAVNMLVEGTGKVWLIDESGKYHPVDASAAQKPAFSRTWLPSLLRQLSSKIRSKPASIEAVPSSTDLGDVDRVPTPVPGSGSRAGDSDGYESTASGATTPVTAAGGGGGVEGDGKLMNRKMRRAELKKGKKKA